MRVDCDEPVRLADRAAARQLHGRQRGDRRAHHGRAAATRPASRRTVARLGVAFQLTNFIRDVREDYGLDRIYLPGLPEDDLRAAHATAPVRERVAQEVGRAAALFADTAGVAAGLAPRMRPRRGASPARVYGCGARPRRAQRLRRPRRAARACARGRPRAAALRAHDRPRDDARRASARRLDGTRADVLVCGASFAGLAVARELARRAPAADVLVIDRYEIGERQTSACAVPDAVAARDGRRGGGPRGAARHDLHHAARQRALPAALELDRVRLPRRSAASCGRSAARRASRRPRSRARTGDVVHTDRGDLHAPLIVDALGWRRVLAASRATSRPTRR